MPIKTTPFDTAAQFSGAKDQVDLLKDAHESGDESYIKHAHDVVDRARRTADRPLSESVSALQEEADRIGVVDPAFDQKAHSDDL